MAEDGGFDFGGGQDKGAAGDDGGMGGGGFDWGGPGSIITPSDTPGFDLGGFSDGLPAGLDPNNSYAPGPGGNGYYDFGGYDFTYYSPQFTTDGEFSSWAPNYAAVPSGYYTDEGYTDRAGFHPYYSDLQRQNYFSGQFGNPYFDFPDAPGAPTYHDTFPDFGGAPDVGGVGGTPGGGTGGIPDFGGAPDVGGDVGLPGGGDLPGSDVGGGLIGGGSDPFGGQLPGGGDLGGGDLPGYETPTSGPGQPAWYSAAQNTYGTPTGPAGANATPDIAALARSYESPVAGMLTGGDTPAGMAADAGLGNGADGGGSSDLTARGGSGTGTGRGGGGGSNSSTDSFLSNFGIKNPLATALAAGGMAANMLRGNQITSEQRNLSNLAAPMMANGQQLTAEGAAIGRQGVDDLRGRASTTDPQSQELINRGTGLTGYLGTGKLPPEIQAQVDQAKTDAITARRSYYASRGMPTDPMRNTSLQQDIARIERDSMVLGGQLAQQLATTGTNIVGAGSNLNQVSGNMQKSAADIGNNFVTGGLQSSNIAASVYNNLARIDAEQTANTQKSIAAMAAALGGGTPRITIG